MIATNHTTGGNYRSPVFDADGNLIDEMTIIK